MGSGKRIRHRLFQSLMVIVISLVACPLMANTNVKLSGTMPAGGDVALFEVSPDGRYAVFLADARVNGIPELFSTPIGGGPRNSLTPPLSLGMAVLGFTISPDSTRVVYWTGSPGGSANGLYSVPINGGEQTNLAGQLSPGTSISNVTIEPTGEKVVYLSRRTASVELPFEEKMWAVWITGGSPITLYGHGCDVCEIFFETIPDGLGVVTRFRTAGPGQWIKAFSFSGGEVLLYNDYAHFVISPDGKRMVYLNLGPKAFFSIPITGGAATQLTDPLPSFSSINPVILISPDSKTVVCRIDALMRGRYELFSFSTTEKVLAKRLTTGIIDEGDVMDFQITPNSLGVVFRGNIEVAERVDLYAAAINGSLGFKLNGENGNVSDFAVTPNSLGVVFRADKDGDGRNNLFAVAINSTGLRTLNTALPAGGEVFDFQIAPNNKGVVYRADQETSDVIALYAVSILGGAPLRVNGPLVSGGDVTTYAITPDSKSVVYLADQETDNTWELFCTFERVALYLPLVLR